MDVVPGVRPKRLLVSSLNHILCAFILRDCFALLCSIQSYGMYGRLAALSCGDVRGAWTSNLTFADNSTL